MDSKQLNIVITRHDPQRTRAGLTWESYIYAKIADGGLSFAEAVEIAHSVNLPPTVQAEIEIRLYERAGALMAKERATARYTAMFAIEGE